MLILPSWPRHGAPSFSAPGSVGKRPFTAVSTFLSSRSRLGKNQNGARCRFETDGRKTPWMFDCWISVSEKRWRASSEVKPYVINCEDAAINRISHLSMSGVLSKGWIWRLFGVKVEKISRIFSTLIRWNIQTSSESGRPKYTPCCVFAWIYFWNRLIQFVNSVQRKKNIFLYNILIKFFIKIIKNSFCSWSILFLVLSLS